MPTVNLTPSSVLTFQDVITILQNIFEVGVVTSGNSNSLDIQYDSVDRGIIETEVFGDGLDIDFEGNLIGGFVTGVDLFVFGQFQGSVTGINLSALTIEDAVEDDTSGFDAFAFEELFLDLNWVYNGSNAEEDSTSTTLIGDDGVVFNLAAADVVVLGGGDDVFFSGDGDDIIAGGSGDDLLDGGFGIDTAVYAANSFDVGFNRINSNSFSLNATTSGEGIDTLIDIERVVFTNGTVAHDVDGNAGQVYRLYQAAFDRTPDLEGLGVNISLIDDGLTLEQMANAFIASNEFQLRFGSNPSDAVFINALYNNVLDRNADPAGFADWQGLLDDGSYLREDVLIGFSESPENKALVAPVIDDGFFIN